MIYLAAFGLYLVTVAVISIRSPSALLSALFSIFAIKGWLIASNPTFASSPMLVNFAYGAVIGVIALAHLRTASRNLINRPSIWLPAVALYVYAFISSLWSPEAAKAGELWKTAYIYILINIAVLPLLISECNWATFSRIQIALGTLLGAVLLFTAEWGTRGLLLKDYSQTNPLEIAQLGAVTGLCAIFAPMRRSLFNTLVRLLAIGFAVALILKSGSRGQLISMIFSSLVVWIAINGIFNVRKTLLLIVAGAVLSYAVSWGIAEFWSTTNPDRYSADTMTEDVQGRLNMATKLIAAWFDSPISILFGLGNSASFDPSIIGIYPHFLPLEILGEEGFVGFAVYFAIVLLITGKVLKSLRYVRTKRYLPGEIAGFSLGTSIWIYTFLLTLKQGNLLGNTVFFTISIILATSLTHCERAMRGRLRGRLQTASQPAVTELSSTGKILRPPHTREESSCL